MDELYQRAKLYDSLHADYHEDGDFLSRFIARELHDAPCSIVEVACGTGRVLSRISQYASAPYQLFGLDISQAMLSIAANRLPTAHFGLADMRDNAQCRDAMKGFGVRSGADVVLLVANSLSHISLLDERCRVYRNLAHMCNPQGFVVIAVMLHESFTDSQEGTVHVGSARDDEADYEVYESSRILSDDTQEVSWFFVSDSGESDFFNTFELVRFAPGQLIREIQSQGYSVEQRYPGFAGEENWEICVYRPGTNTVK